MLKSVDILIGFSLVMLVASAAVTVFAQTLAALLQLRGRRLLDGLTSILEQIDPELQKQLGDRAKTVAGEIAAAVLKHPLVAEGNKRLGTVIQREDLTKILLELATGQGAAVLQEDTRAALQQALQRTGISNPGQALKEIRMLAAELEASNPELATHVRETKAIVTKAASDFVGTVNAWFDGTMDRVTQKYTANMRWITAVFGLILALALQLDSIALLNRLAMDDQLRRSLVSEAPQILEGYQTSIDKLSQKVPPAPSQQPAPSQPTGQDLQPPADPTAAVKRLPVQPQTERKGYPERAKEKRSSEQLDPKQELTNLEASVRDLQKLAASSLITLPGTAQWSWFEPAKIPGILLTAILLSLGASFWYDALKNLLRLRPALASQEQTERESRRASQPSSRNNDLEDTEPKAP
ncbi:MAG TPA: hypothetical protein VMU60_01610 [Syntrophobacteria bacterium]|nr:hypothetical protein [Syntrophobacteria bacterium]